jgi:hypothetical protein
MLHRQCRDGVFPKGHVDNPPTGKKKDKPRGRNERSGLAHQMKSENVRGDEDHQAENRSDIKGHDDLFRQWLSLLYGWLNKMLKNPCEVCHSERSEESRSGYKGLARFLASLGMTD